MPKVATAVIGRCVCLVLSSLGMHVWSCTIVLGLRAARSGKASSDGFLDLRGWAFLGLIPGSSVHVVHKLCATSLEVVFCVVLPSARGPGASMASLS